MQTWIMPAIATFFAWGIWAFLPKITTRYINEGSAMVYQSLGGIIIGLGVLISMKFRLEFNPPGFTFGVATGLFGFFGAFTYLLAVTRGPLTLVAPLTALYPVLAILLGILFLNEAITLKQSFGILLSLVSIILIST